MGNWRKTELLLMSQTITMFRRRFHMKAIKKNELSISSVLYRPLLRFSLKYTKGDTQICISPKINFEEDGKGKR